MRSRSIRSVVGALAFAVASSSLVACTKDTATDKAADKATETTTVETSAAEAAAGSTTIAAAPTTVAVSGAPAEPATTTTVLTGSAATAFAPNNNIFYTAVGAGSFLTLAKLLANADLIETIKGEGPFTVFAPTDAAFAAVPAETLNALLADKAKLTKVLLYHVVPGRVMSADLKAGDVATAEGASLRISVDAVTVGVNDAHVAVPDIVASNGVIHVVDKVLIPPDL